MALEAQPPLLEIWRAALFLAKVFSVNAARTSICLPKRFNLALVIFLLIWSGVAKADLPRTPVKDTPHLFGRDVERLVLKAPILADRSQPGLPFASTIMVRIPPDIFIPVAEDKEGVFYQAESGFRKIRGNYIVPGGLYVSKLRDKEIWLYQGDAQVGSKFGVDKDTLPLPARLLRHLRVGKAERKR